MGADDVVNRLESGVARSDFLFASQGFGVVNQGGGFQFRDVLNVLDEFGEGEFSGFDSRDDRMRGLQQCGVIGGGRFECGGGIGFWFCRLLGCGSQDANCLGAVNLAAFFVDSGNATGTGIGTSPGELINLAHAANVIHALYAVLRLGHDDRRWPEVRLAR